MKRDFFTVLFFLLVPCIALAVSVKISELPDAGTITGAEQLPVVQSGVTKKTNVNHLPFQTIAAQSQYSSNVQNQLNNKQAAGSYVTSARMTSYSSARQAELEGKQVKLLTFYNASTCSSTKAIDPANAKHQKLRLTGNCTITIALTGVANYIRELVLQVVQGLSPHNYTVTVNKTGGTKVSWPYGTAPVFTTYSGARDFVTCVVDDTNANCNYSPHMKVAP